MRLTKEQLREAIETVYNKMTNGLSDQEIAEDMGIALEDFLDIKKGMFETKSEEITKRPPEHIYVEYMIEQGKNLKDLSNMISDFSSSKQYSAMVAAVRARADILDKLLTKGQEFGLIHKEPDKKFIVAGISVRELTNEKLKSLVVGELKMLNKLIKRNGDKNFMEVEEPELYSGEGLVIENKQEELKALPPLKEEFSKTKSNTSKVHKGRKRVMIPEILERQ